MAINFNKVEFILSAASEKQFVRDGMPQLAFAGRSNVGKSSVINRLVNRKNFARVGASPGKTSQINYFKIDGKLYLVDLPGYGYAKVSKTERDRWGKLMESYFQSAGLIHLGVQIVDARHKPTADDVTMHDYFVQTGCPVVIVANKLDKLKAREIEPNLAQIRETLSLRDDELVIPFSAEKGTGKEQKIRIEASSGLTEQEIQRMRDEAKANEEKDKAEKERIDKINAADSNIFTTEKQLKEYGEKLPADKKAAIETALGKLKEAHKNADVAAIDTAMAELNAAWQAASQDIYAQQQAQQGAQPGADAGQQSQSNAGGQQGGGDGQPEDVEFEEVK